MATATTAEVHQLFPAQLLECSKCGKTAAAPCGCDSPYLTPFERATKAIEADSDRSNSAIAADLGIAEATVRRAREAGSSKNEREEDGSSGSAKKRTGKDGKKYPAKKRKKAKAKKPATRRKPPPEEEDTEEQKATPAEYRAGFLIRCTDIRRYAFYEGPFKKGWAQEFAAAAREVASAWSQLADKLEKQQNVLQENVR